MLFQKKISTFAALLGRMAEWLNAAVLKTVDLHGSGGSNPSSSAKAGAYGAPVLLQKRDSVNLILICYANALHFISLGGPPGPRSRSMIQLGTDPFCIIFDFLINEKSVQMGFRTLLGVK